MMANVSVEARPKGRQEGTAIEGYVVEDHADHVLHTCGIQQDAIARAKSSGHVPHVARVRHLNDKRDAIPLARDLGTRARMATSLQCAR